MNETPVGIELVNSSQKFDKLEIRGIDQLIERCKRNESQRLFQLQKLIGWLPTLDDDHEEDEEVGDETIYVGPARSSHEKYSILPVVQLRGITRKTTVEDLVKAYCLNSLNISLSVTKESLQIETW